MKALDKQDSTKRLKVFTTLLYLDEHTQKVVLVINGREERERKKNVWSLRLSGCLEISNLPSVFSSVYKHSGSESSSLIVALFFGCFSTFLSSGFSTKPFQNFICLGSIKSRRSDFDIFFGMETNYGLTHKVPCHMTKF